MESLAFLSLSLYTIYHSYTNEKHPTSSALTVLRLGTRKSALAMAQTFHIKALIESHFPDSLTVEIIEPLDTIGDKTLCVYLKILAAKTPGLFTKDLEEGLLQGKYDAVVHSLKDMPTTLPDGLTLAAITAREDPRDVVVFRTDSTVTSLDQLPNDAVIGTSSVRREAILKRVYSSKNFKYNIVRGNVNTRLAKLDSGEYDAIILAAAGLKRLGAEFEQRIGEYLEPPEFLYGVGQGALGLECAANNKAVIDILKSCECREATVRCRAERALLRALDGGCQVPIGVHSKVLHEKPAKLVLQACVLDEEGKERINAQCVEVLKEFSDKEAERIGEKLAEVLKKNGAREILGRMRPVVDTSKNIQNATRPLTYGSAENPHVEMRPVSVGK